MLYLAYGSNLDPQQMAERCPSRAYLKHLIDGARAHGLPEAYQAMLAKIECGEGTS